MTPYQIERRLYEIRKQVRELGLETNDEITQILVKAEDILFEASEKARG